MTGARPMFARSPRRSTSQARRWVVQFRMTFFDGVPQRRCSNAEALRLSGASKAASACRYASSSVAEERVAGEASHRNWLWLVRFGSG